jgi:L-galactose dehydrogenase
MEYRPLGRTGLTVSVLGYGASPLGGVYGRVDVAEAVNSVHAALDLGVNFIDVAPYYGATQAEAVLGQALHGVDRERYVLATKVGRYGDDDFDLSAQRVVRSVEESLVRLGAEHIDVVQCHDIEFVDPRPVVEEALPALERLRVAGKIRFLGVTGYPLEVLAAIAGQLHLDTVLSYCRYTLLDRTLLRWAPRFHALGTGVINASPFAMGLLRGAEAPGWHPAPAPYGTRPAGSPSYATAAASTWPRSRSSSPCNRLSSPPPSSVRRPSPRCRATSTGSPNPWMMSSSVRSRRCSAHNSTPAGELVRPTDGPGHAVRAHAQGRHGWALVNRPDNRRSVWRKCCR